MDASSSIIDAQLYSLVADAVRLGLETSKALKEDSYRRKHDSVFTLTYRENHLPKFNRVSFPELIDYTEVFNDAKIEFDESPLFQAILEHIKSIERLRAFFLLDTALSLLSPYYVARIPLEIIDGYIHQYMSFDFQTDRFEALYCPLERGIYQEKLPVDIMVPILFISFDFDQVELGNDAKIVRMDERFQKARRRRYIASGFNETPMEASHALVLHNSWIIDSKNVHSFGNVYAASSDVTQWIDAFFAALRVVCPSATGYFQVIKKCVGWVDSYRADEPAIGITETKQYAAQLERRNWDEAVGTVLGEAEVRTIAEIFGKVISKESKELSLAARRLNQCLLRESEEDSILDAMIALEALLLRESQELTYRLSLRTAALLSASGKFKGRSVPIYRTVRKLYDYRSAVVHGNTDEKEWKIEAPDGTGKVQAIELAVEYLRMVIKALVVDNIRYLDDPKLIDEDLLLYIPQE